VSPTVDWDAAAYDDLADVPHDAWAEQVLGRLELAGNETVLDAGCGTGRMIALLRERHPGLTLIGADGSPKMLERARENLGEGVQLIESNLLELEIDVPVDVIVSNAVFHWITEHQILFDRMFALLRPGGRLEAQCGGEGNIAEVERAVDALAGYERFAPYLRGEHQAWNYASVGDTELRLARAGFERALAWLEPWPVEPRDPRRYLATVVLPWHLERLPPPLRDDFIDAVLGSAPRPLVIEYVRLNISARRPA
jgi:trans-aconitate 2-methyltransferase